MKFNGAESLLMVMCGCACGLCEVIDVTRHTSFPPLRLWFESDLRYLYLDLTVVQFIHIVGILFLWNQPAPCGSGICSKIA